MLRLAGRLAAACGAPAALTQYPAERYCSTALQRAPHAHLPHAASRPSPHVPPALNPWPAGPFRIFLPDQWAPGLAVARAFGDLMASDIGVTATPEFAVFPLPAPPSAPSFCGGGDGSGYGTGAPGRPGFAGGRRGQAVAGAAGLGAPSFAAGRSAPPGAGRGRACRQQAAGAGGFLGGSARAPPPSQLLIVASDGLWEWVSSQKAVQIAAAAGSAEDAAHALVETAQKEWAQKYLGRNCDDITVAVCYI